MRTLLATLILALSTLAALGQPYAAGEVRPWSAYLGAKAAVREASPRRTDAALALMIERLGPLPWRFNVEADTPFTSPAVVNELYTATENDGFHPVLMARARFEYPENKGALQSEDLAIWGLIQNVSPRDDYSKYRWSAPGGVLYR